VIGVSSDSIQSHKRFAAKHQLQFKLLSDRDGPCGAVRCGADPGNSAGRVTYVIDRDRVVQHMYSSQLAATRHVREARQALRCMVQ